MYLSEEVKHDLLLVISSMIFILFVTGCAGSQETETEPIIIPSI